MNSARGISNYTVWFERPMLRQMYKRLLHRGPDDGDVIATPGEGVGLAHRRHSTIDLSPLGRQPMCDVTGSVVIVFNGELHNYITLRQELEEKGSGAGWS